MAKPLSTLMSLSHSNAECRVHSAKPILRNDMTTCKDRTDVLSSACLKIHHLQAWQMGYERIHMSDLVLRCGVRPAGTTVEIACVVTRSQELEYYIK
jgi:hypothetical protein